MHFKQTITQTFMLKVQQRDWTMKTSSEKLTLTCVNYMHVPFAKVVSLLVLYNLEISAGARL